jgi:hypothetical protein
VGWPTPWTMRCEHAFWELFLPHCCPGVSGLTSAVGFLHR